MKPKAFMLIAGEASGDLLAAEYACRRRREESLIKSVTDRTSRSLSLVTPTPTNQFLVGDDMRSL